MPIYLIYLTTFLVSLGLSYLLYRVLSALRIVDFPNSRSSHLSPTPQGGGLAIVIAFFVALALSGFDTFSSDDFFQVLMIGGAGIALIGLIDDFYGLSPIVRFIATLMIAALCVSQLSMPSVSFIGFTLQPSAILFICQVLSVAWILNLFNFMDGIDAIASVETISVAVLAVALLAWFSPPSESIGVSIGMSNAVSAAMSIDLQVQVLVIIACATLGFLVWNWPPAKLFMGDSGSTFLGFVLALFAVQTSVEQTMNIWVWLILFGVFFVDATATMFQRMFRGEKIYKAHRQHTCQRVAIYLQNNKAAAPEVARAYAHRTVSLVIVAINFLWLAPWAYLAKLYGKWGMLFALVALLPLLVFHLRLPERYKIGNS